MGTKPQACSRGDLAHAATHRLGTHYTFHHQECKTTTARAQRTALAPCRCEPSRAPLRIAVLLSGGVDSSLSLALLKAAGHDVHAFYLQIWFQEDFRNFWGACPWEEDLQYAEQVWARRRALSGYAMP